MINLRTTSLAALLGLTLAACSSSSGNGAVETDPASDQGTADSLEVNEDIADDRVAETSETGADQTFEDRAETDMVECNEQLTTIDTAIPVSVDGSLEAYVRLPEGCAPTGGWPAVLWIHGLGGSRDVVENNAVTYTEAGYVTLAYSVRGQGDSSGPGSYLGPTERGDLSTAIAWLKDNYPVDPDAIGVIGTSQGGFHSYAAALQDMGVAAVAPGNFVVSLVEDFLPGQCLDTGLMAAANSTPSADFGDLSPQVTADIEAQDVAGLTAFLDERDLSAQLASVSTPISLQLAWSDSVFKSDLGLEEYQNIVSDKVLFVSVGGHGSGFDMDVQQARDGVNLNWFDHYLRGEPLERPPGSVWYAYMDYTRAGTERWVQGELDSWPPATSDLVLHFTSTGTLANASESGGTSLGTVEHNPDEGYDTTDLMADVSAAISRQPAQRREGRETLEAAFPGADFEFTSEPFDEPFLWFGTAHLSTRVLADAHFQLAVHVHEVVGSGATAREVLLSTGRLCRWAQDTSPSDLEIPLEARGQQIRAGSRLKVTITHLDMSSDTVHTYPLHDPFSLELRGGTAHPTTLTIPVFEP